MNALASKGEWETGLKRVPILANNLFRFARLAPLAALRVAIVALASLPSGSLAAADVAAVLLLLSRPTSAP